MVATSPRIKERQTFKINLTDGYGNWSGEVQYICS